jgi:hypothetical protein
MTDVAPGARPFSPNESRRFLSLLWQAGGVREIRIPKHNKYGQTGSGYFDNIEDAVAAAEAWDRRANIYVTLNEVNPALLTRAANRIDPRASAASADDDVAEREWLFIDIDPTRPSGISSSEGELASAQHLLSNLSEFLAAAGWPEPVACMSGNGCYALYRVSLLNDPAATVLVKRVLESLAARFNTEGAHIDTSVCNPARIIALIGTMKMKGDATPERPHRRSYIISAPEQPAVVLRDQLERVASSAVSAATGARSLSRIDPSRELVSVLDAAGIEYREQLPDANGFTWYHVRQCPFHDDGRPFECGVGQKLPDGPYAGHCFHPEGLERGWQDFKRALGLKVGGEAPIIHDPATEGAGGRPRIVVTNRYRREIVEDSWRALLAANDPVRFFRHGNGGAEIDTNEDGSACIQHLTTAGLAGRLDRCADFIKLTQTGQHPARPPRDVVEDMEALEIPLPPLRGIVGAPVFAPDGSLETKTGYQPSTGLYYAPIGERVPAVPARPDASDLRAARLRLGNDLLGDFPWADERASLANLLAALITPMVRELIAGPVPLYALDAPKAGNGKGLLATCISLVTTGHEIAVMADTKSEEEFRKRVTTKLMEGDGVLLFDNVRRRLDSGSFAALLTANVWTDRILGRSQAVTLPIRSLFLVTGNNLQFSDEITRRTVSVRLDAKVDRPWEGRVFRHPDLPDWLRRHRHEVVWACLVLAQNWIAQGRPPWTGSPMGSYESWCGVLGGILEAAGIGGFLENRPDLYRRGDTDSEEWRAFTSAWWNSHGNEPVKVADLQPIAEETLVGFFDGLKDGADNKKVRTKLGKAIAERRDTRFEDLFVRRAGEDGHSKTALWFVEPAAPPTGITAETGTTPAPYSPEKRPFSDSVAGDAGIAGINSDLLQQMDSSSDATDVCGESGNPYPQYPPTPQAESKLAPNGAGDVRGTAEEPAAYPQCKRCGCVLEPSHSNLCAACRQDALRRVMEGQR